MDESPSLSLETTYRHYLAAIVTFHHQMAIRMGLGATDYQAINVLAMHGPMLAGELARAIGLSKGATTRMIDRLVEKGYAARMQSRSDGRNVTVSLARRLPDDSEAALADVRDRVGAVLQGMSAEELRVLESYFSGATLAYQGATQHMATVVKGTSTTD